MTLRLIDGAVPSSHDLHIWARRSRALMIGASLYRLARIVIAWLRKLAAARVSEMRQRRAIRQLHQLDDRMLADIGLARSTIESVVRNAKPAPLQPVRITARANGRRRSAPG